MILERVISGGQSGADQGGLRAARSVGLPTGGWAPRGWWAEVYEKGRRPRYVPAPGLREFGLAECDQPDNVNDIAECFRVRTRLNVRDSDATVIFARDDRSPGSALTIGQCIRLGKHWLRVRPGVLNEGRVRHLADWLSDRDIRVLNVAGHRESAMPGIGAWVETYLSAVFAPLGSPR